MRVAIVHDDLVQWGGAERVLYGLTKIFPDAPIFTSVFDLKNSLLKEKFKSKKIITSFMQKIPLHELVYKQLLPLYPIAFEQFNFSEFDLVISHTTRFAKSVVTKPKTKHISYCHTPPRFLWHFSGSNESVFLKPYFSKLRIYDQISAKRVDFFLAGSKNAKSRIKKVYKKNSEVLYPFVDEFFFQSDLSFEGEYYLIVSRLNDYKKVNIAIEAFNELDLNLKIVGSGPEKLNLIKKADKNIEILGNVTDDLLLDLIAGCKALIIPGEEDFGLVSLEAQAMGKPVIAFRCPGLEETVIEEKTGIFFNEQSSEDLKQTIKRAEKSRFKVNDFIANANNFNFENFKKKFLAKLNF